jgi:transposase
MEKISGDILFAIRNSLFNSGRLKRSGSKRLNRKVPIKEIAKKLKVSVSTVYRCEKRFKGKDSPEYFSQKRGTGRPLRFGKKILANVMEDFAVSGSLWSLDRLRQHLVEEKYIGITLDDDALLRILNQLGIALKKFKEASLGVPGIEKAVIEAQKEKGLVYHVSRDTVLKAWIGNVPTAKQRKIRPRDTNKYHILYMVSRSGVKRSYFSVSKRKSLTRLLDNFKELSGKMSGRTIFAATKDIEKTTIEKIRKQFRNLVL